MTLQILAVQALASMYQSIGYLFSQGAIIDGNRNLSDTQVMAEYLLLPHWFWAIVLLVISIFMIYKSFKFVLVRKSPDEYNLVRIQ